MGDEENEQVAVCKVTDTSGKSSERGIMASKSHPPNLYPLLLLLYSTLPFFFSWFPITTFSLLSVVRKTVGWKTLIHVLYPVLNGQPEEDFQIIAEATFFKSLTAWECAGSKAQGFQKVSWKAITWPPGDIACSFSSSCSEEKQHCKLMGEIVAKKTPDLKLFILVFHHVLGLQNKGAIFARTFLKIVRQRNTPSMENSRRDHYKAKFPTPCNFAKHKEEDMDCCGDLCWCQLHWNDTRSWYCGAVPHSITSASAQKTELFLSKWQWNRPQLYFK